MGKTSFCHVALCSGRRVPKSAPRCTVDLGIWKEWRADVYHQAVFRLISIASILFDLQTLVCVFEACHKIGLDAVIVTYLHFKSRISCWFHLLKLSKRKGSLVYSLNHLNRHIAWCVLESYQQCNVEWPWDHWAVDVTVLLRVKNAVNPNLWILKSIMISVFCGPGCYLLIKFVQVRHNESINHVSHLTEHNTRFKPTPTFDHMVPFLQDYLYHRLWHVGQRSLILAEISTDLGVT